MVNLGIETSKPVTVMEESKVDLALMGLRLRKYIKLREN